MLGSGIHESELSGVELVGPEVMSDLMLDSVVRGRVELRVRLSSSSPKPMLDPLSLVAVLCGPLEPARWPRESVPVSGTR